MGPSHSLCRDTPQLVFFLMYLIGPVYPRVRPMYWVALLKSHAHEYAKRTHTNVQRTPLPPFSIKGLIFPNLQTIIGSSI